MSSQREQLVQRVNNTNDTPPAQANRIYYLLAQFADYWLNKSHAPASAIIPYPTA